MMRLATSLRLKHSAVIALSLFASIRIGSAQAQPPAPFVTHSIKPNVYWVEGGGGNSGVIVGANEGVVVDAKARPAHRAACQVPRGRRCPSGCLPHTGRHR